MSENNTHQLQNEQPKAVEVMGRKAFNSLIYDLYDCQAQNDVKADLEVSGEDIYRVEVFRSPEGLLIAAHELHRVHVIRPSAILRLNDTEADAFLDGDIEPKPEGDGLLVWDASDDAVFESGSTEERK